jgi:hypothetical protein
VSLAVVHRLQAVEVGEEDGEPARAGTAADERRVERTRVEQPREEVPLGQALQAVDERTVPTRERADQGAAEDVGDGADRRRGREHVRARDPVVDEHARDVEDGRERTGTRAEERAARKRDERDREVEEVADPESGHLERHVGDRDRRVRREGRRHECTAVREGRIHLPLRSPGAGSCPSLGRGFDAEGGSER